MGSRGVSRKKANTPRPGTLLGHVANTAAHGSPASGMVQERGKESLLSRRKLSHPEAPGAPLSPYLSARAMGLGLSHLQSQPHAGQAQAAPRQRRSVFCQPVSEGHVSGAGGGRGTQRRRMRNSGASPCNTAVIYCSILMTTACQRDCETKSKSTRPCWEPGSGGFTPRCFPLLAGNLWSVWGHQEQRHDTTWEERRRVQAHWWSLSGDRVLAEPWCPRAHNSNVCGQGAHGSQ